MKNVRIDNPCQENWNEMLPSAKGAFCERCATEVIDFTSKTGPEIKEILRSMIGKPVCSRISKTQMDALDTEMQVWQLNTSRQFQSTLLFSLVVVFGLTLFSCSTQNEKEMILKMQQTVSQVVDEQQIQVSEIEEKEVSVINEIPEAYYFLEEIAPAEDVLHHFQKEPASDSDPDSLKLNMENLKYSMVGGMAWTSRFEDFLIADAEIDSTEYDENGIGIPKTFLSKAYPNPSIVDTKLEIGLPEDDLMEINLYDLNGRLIQPIFSGNVKRGTHTYPVNVMELPAGTYLFAIRGKLYSEVVRIVKV